MPTWTWGHWTHSKYFPNPQNEVDSLTTAVVTYHSPVLTLRAAPISRLWMLRPGDTNETKKKMPILALEGTTQCKGHFRIFFLPAWAVTLTLSCWLILSGPQTFSHEAAITTIHNALYRQRKANEKFRRQDRQAVKHTSEANTMYFSIASNISYTQHTSS